MNWRKRAGLPPRESGGGQKGKESAAPESPQEGQCPFCEGDKIDPALRKKYENNRAKTREQDAFSVGGRRLFIASFFARRLHRLADILVLARTTRRGESGSGLEGMGERAISKTTCGYFWWRNSAGDIADVH